MKDRPLPAGVQVDSLTFAELFQRLYEARSTGKVEIHMLHGVAKYADVTARIVLDTGAKKAQT